MTDEDAPLEVHRLTASRLDFGCDAIVRDTNTRPSYASVHVYGLRAGRTVDVWVSQNTPHALTLVDAYNAQGLVAVISDAPAVRDRYQEPALLIGIHARHRRFFSRARGRRILRMFLEHINQHAAPAALAPA